MRNNAASWFLVCGLLTQCMIVVAADVVDISYRRKAVRSLTIDVNRNVNKGSSATPGVEDCGRFALTERTVRSYLAKAIAVESLHDYQYGGCEANGHVVFTDGSRAQWLIMSSRIGYLTFDDGRAFNLFCRWPTCQDKVYWQGTNSDSEEAEKDERLAREAERRRKARKPAAEPLTPR